MRPLVVFLALLGALPAFPAAARDPCRFTQEQPRFYQARTPLTAFHVAQEGSLFLNDVLLRTVTRQLGLADCQVQLAAGEECSAALAAAPCTDPLWLCGGQLTVSNSVYQAASSGMCSAYGNAAAPAVCQTLRTHPAIARYSAAGRCQPACFAQLTPDAGDHGSLAPAPAPSSASVGTCLTFALQLDTASEAEAQAAAANLHNATTAGALLDALASFAAPGHPLKFVVGDSGGW